MLIPTRMDWLRVEKLLLNEWPVPMPLPNVLLEPSQAEQLFDELEQLEWVVVDTEYFPDSKLLKLIGIGGWDDVRQCYVHGQLEFIHTHAAKYTRSTFIERYARLIKRLPVWAWNLKADLPVLKQNINVGGERFQDYLRFDDGMVLHHILWSDQEHSLEFVASLLGIHDKLKHLSRTNPILYNLGDVCETIQIVRTLLQQLQLDSRLRDVYERKRRLVPIIIEREQVGLRVNQARVSEAIPKYQAKLQEVATLAEAYCGYPLNLLSPGKTGQLARYLNEVEGFTLDSVSKDDISEVRRALLPFNADDEKKNFPLDYLLQRVDEDAHPLLELRALMAHDNQILTHFLNKMQGQERCYPEIQLHTQASGRHSTVDPPLPTFPDDLTDIILPELGHVEWSYDWDQIELRIIAAEANDAPLLKAFDQHYDLHTLSACDIFGLRYPPDLVDPNRHCNEGEALDEWQRATHWNGKKDLRRRFAKVFVYRLLYGAKPETCTDIPGVVVLGLDTRGLVRASHNWLNRHPAVRSYQLQLASQATKTGQVYSFMGRRRTLQETGEEAARQAMNHPMQGGCMDVYEEVMYEIDRTFYPVLKFRWGAHDSQKWNMPELTYRSDDGQVLLRQAAAIVQQPRVINGREVKFPATFLVMYDDGRTEAWHG